MPKRSHPDRTRRSRLALALGLLALLLPALSACGGGGGIDLDPSQHREVAKTPSVLTNPPQELRNGTAQ